MRYGQAVAYAAQRSHCIARVDRDANYANLSADLRRFEEDSRRFDWIAVQMRAANEHLL